MKIEIHLCQEIKHIHQDNKHEHKQPKQYDAVDVETQQSTRPVQVLIINHYS